MNCLRTFYSALLVLFALISPLGAEEPTITLSQQTLNKIKPIYELIDAEKLPEAEQQLTKLLGELSPKGIDWAFTKQLAGYVAFDTHAYKRAAEHFQAALAHESFPDSLRLTTTLDYGQALLQFGQKKQAVAVLSSIKDVSKLSPQSQVSLAMAFLETGQATRSVELFRGLWKKDTSRFPAAWYKGYAAALDEVGHHKLLQSLMEKYRQRWPKDREGWLYGAQAALDQGNHGEAFTLYRAAYDLGILKDERSLLALSGLAFEADVPLEGARILKASLLEGRVKPSHASYRLLSDLYVASRHIEVAVAVLEQAQQKFNFPELGERVQELRDFLSSRKRTSRTPEESSSDS